MAEIKQHPIRLHRSRAHLDLQIEGDQDRLEGWPYQRIRIALSAPSLPLRGVQRLARNRAPGATARTGDLAISVVHAGAQDGERGAGRQLRHTNFVERRPRQRHLFLRAPAEDFSRVKTMSFSDNLESNLKNLESIDERDPVSAMRNERQKQSQRVHAIAAAPHAEKLRSGKFTSGLLTHSTPSPTREAIRCSSSPCRGSCRAQR